MGDVVQAFEGEEEQKPFDLAEFFDGCKDEFHLKPIVIGYRRGDNVFAVLSGEEDMARIYLHLGLAMDHILACKVNSDRRFEGEEFMSEIERTRAETATVIPLNGGDAA